MEDKSMSEYVRNLILRDMKGRKSMDAIGQVEHFLEIQELIRKNKATPSLIQRRFRIGHKEAIALLEKARMKTDV